MSLLERIYYFHEELKNNRFPNSKSLSNQFEISPATSRRDIAYLRDRLLAPIAFDRQKNGFFYTDQDFSLPFENSPKIISLLAMLNKLAEEAGLGQLPEVKKLTKRLSTLLDPDLARLIDSIYYEWVEVESIDPVIFQTILESLIRSKRLTISYRSVKGESSSRSIDPLRLINYQGRWYLLSFCHLRGHHRLFHIARISNVRISNDPIIEKSGETTRYIEDSFGIFKGKTIYQAQILFTSTAAELVRHQHWHRDQQITMTSEGVLLTIPISDDREILMKILQYGRMAKVIKPRSLKDRIQAEITAMAQCYQE